MQLVSHQLVAYDDERNSYRPAVTNTRRIIYDSTALGRQERQTKVHRTTLRCVYTPYLTKS